MTTANIQKALANVTAEQIARAHRTYDLNVNPPVVFYQVESESGAFIGDEDGEQHLLTYRVNYSKARGFTCTCKEGKTGFQNCRKNGVCKHVVWSVAAAIELANDEAAEQLEIATLLGQGVSIAEASILTFFGFLTEAEFEQESAVVRTAGAPVYSTTQNAAGVRCERIGGRLVPLN